MSEFEQGSNQTSNEPVIEQQQAPEAPQIETQTQPETAPPQAFTVKYNKEEMQIPYEQAPDYIQKGLNYDKVNQRATTYEQQLNRLAQMSGYQTVDELTAAIEAYEKQQERQRYVDAGIDPDVLNQFLEQHPDMQYAREMKAKEQEQARVSQEVSELRGMFPDISFDSIPESTWQLKEQAGISLLDAYLRTNWQSLAQQKEQEAIQKIQQNQSASAGSLSGGNVNHSPVGVSNMSSSDFAKLVERVKRGENVQL